MRLFTDTQVNNYISIYEPVNQRSQKLQSWYFYAVFSNLWTNSEVDSCFVLALQFLLLLWIWDKFRRFLCIDWDGLNSLKLSGNRDARLSNFVCSHASQNILGYIVNQSERAIKHYSLVWYMLTAMSTSVSVKSICGSVNILVYSPPLRWIIAHYHIPNQWRVYRALWLVP